MDANKRYASGRLLTYAQFPDKFMYDSDERVWRPRKKGRSIGRLNFVAPGSLELYYMRLLLTRQIGCTSFEDIRTVSGHICESYREACAMLRLLADDHEFLETLDELSILGSGFYLRKSFAKMLLVGTMSDPLKVWLQKWELLSDGLLYNQRRSFGRQDLIISDENIQQMCLGEIDRYLRPSGKSLSDFECMPKILCPNVVPFINIFIENELSYDSSEMLLEHDRLFQCLNSEPLIAYQEIVNALSNNIGRMFFVDGFGGSGKTYLWNALSCKIKSQGKIVLNVSSSGIASLLLLGGRTAHSQFALPLLLTEESMCQIEESMCQIEKEGKKAKLLIMSSLIIWDEAPMINKLAFEALDRSLQDIMSRVADGIFDLPFGGKTIVFGGDFRQILLVIPQGSQTDVVNATINSSMLWRNCKVFKLTQNMRLQFSQNEVDNGSLHQFAKWILDIGDGKLDFLMTGKL